MKLFQKEYINDSTRIIHILNIPFKYTKRIDDSAKFIIYDVEFLSLKFSFKKRKKKFNIVPKVVTDKAIREDALMYSRCIRNLFEKIDNIETMCIGSSTARCGFIDNDKTINMGIDAQDLYYSCAILKKYMKIIPNLKNIVLFWDVFSSGNDLDYHPQKYRMAFYKALYDIPYKNKLVAMENELFKVEEKIYSLDKYIKENLKSIPRDYYPNPAGTMYTMKELTAWAKTEIKLSIKKTMIHHLYNFVCECLENNLKLFIVIFPRNPLVKEFYPETKELFKDIYDIKEKYPEINIINAYDDLNLGSEYFFDILHTKREGAEIVTDYINKIIEERK